MRELKDKAERIKPILKIRRAQLDQEAATLADIRKNKYAALEELRRFQSLYMKGVEELNQLRMNGELDQLPVVEQSLDHVKNKWYQSLKTVKSIEEQERIQVETLLSAQRNLKSIETLGARLAMDIAIYQRQMEQKEQDEGSVQKFNEKRAKA